VPKTNFSCSNFCDMPKEASSFAGAVHNDVVRRPELRSAIDEVIAHLDRYDGGGRAVLVRVATLG